MRIVVKEAGARGLEGRSVHRRGTTPGNVCESMCAYPEGRTEMEQERMARDH